MKKTLLLIALFSLLISPVFGQFTFSVSPGISLNGATFGYKVGKIVPYVGIQMINAKLGVENNSFDYNTPGTLIETVNNTDIKANIFVPTIGAKYFFIQSNKLKAFAGLSLSKPIIHAKVTNEENGVVQTNTGIDQTVSDINDIKIFGGELGFGVEYFFDDNFSVGGEFGLRYLTGKFSQKRNGTAYDGIANHNVVRYTDVNLNLMPTFSKISLNFYFGGGKEVSAN
jgi:hypothetical protein